MKEIELNALNGFNAFLLKNNIIYISGWEFYRDLDGKELYYTDVWVKYTRSINYTF